MREIFWTLDQRIADDPHLEVIEISQEEWEAWIKASFRMTRYPGYLEGTYRGRIIRRKPTPFESVSAGEFNLAKHIEAHRDWSRETFGPDQRTESLVNHIKKELDEILENPTDLTEWIDVMILAIDGAWRAGHDPKQIVLALVNKSLVNMHRKWPDWRTLEPGVPTEHIRDGGDDDDH